MTHACVWTWARRTGINDKGWLKALLYSLKSNANSGNNNDRRMSGLQMFVAGRARASIEYRSTSTRTRRDASRLSPFELSGTASSLPSLSFRHHTSCCPYAAIIRFSTSPLLAWFSALLLWPRYDVRNRMLGGTHRDNCPTFVTSSHPQHHHGRVGVSRAQPSLVCRSRTGASGKWQTLMNVNLHAKLSFA